ncbi:MAG: hypothetical protein O9301_02275 [Leptospira sp.]|nr:hypothetical protein [Leptospira sp.]
MKKLFWIFAILFLTHCGEKPPAKESGFKAEHPIEITVKKLEGKRYQLELFLPKNYGFQVQAPHKILLSGKNGLKVVSADLKLNGPIHPEKMEYFEYVKPMNLEMEGSGSLELDAKLYYCNFQKNICIPGKVNSTFPI